MIVRTYYIVDPDMDRVCVSTVCPQTYLDNPNRKGKVFVVDQEFPDSAIAFLRSDVVEKLHPGTPKTVSTMDKLFGICRDEPGTDEEVFAALENDK